MDEEWRPVPVFPRYSVSSFGRVRGPWKVLAPQTDSSGYFNFRPYQNGGCTTRLLHRAVCHAFHGDPPSSDHQACHLDGNRKNNAALNLAWATRTENASHKQIHGTENIGENSARHKLKDDQVKAIILRSKAGASAKDLASEFGVCRSTIYDIRNGKRRTKKTPTKSNAAARA